ncbi:hypothetical protein EHQ83_18175 [Leptospira yasudae]|uniref:Uncharacterized protein n=1 Tax=Leptospira yasudae TaxID=2202201 RepID=A0A6N4QQ70_9LEPT|nr:hypothetical protein EHQ83_18175 [Leptospira yasudae]TGL81360.1 hypothetical protein EHQ72_05420 [Leptospira yasudae]TGL81796.1 hypothetical protein EHQ77_06935 [Leptospira yasudae]
MEVESEASFPKDCLGLNFKKTPKNTKKSFHFLEKRPNYRKLLCFFEQKQNFWHKSCLSDWSDSGRLDLCPRPKISRKLRLKF